MEQFLFTFMIIFLTPMTISDVIEFIVKELSARNLESQCDTVKCGDPAREITGIATTFMATRRVIADAKRLGVNLLITHEPTFFHDADNPLWLQDDAVCQSKKRWLEESGLVIWRLHDALHDRRPDGILAGMVRELAWEKFAAVGKANVFHLPAKALRVMAEELKEKLGIACVKVVGDLSMICSGAAILPGAARGERQIELLRRTEVDVLICGESAEWTACEYVRDAEAAGEQKALIVLGHANSEEAGMKWFADWLQARWTKTPIFHLAAGDPFQFV